MKFAQWAVIKLEFPPFEGEVKEIIQNPFDPNSGWLETTKWRYMFRFEDGVIKYITQEKAGLSFYDHSAP